MPTIRGTCSLGDGRPHYAHGWCAVHYSRWRRHGDPLIAGRILGNDRARFESKVDRSGGPDCCHPWLAVLDIGGYGYFYIDGRMRDAHIVAWEFKHGPVPPGKELDHECHNRAVVEGACQPGKCAHRTCCNELHLAAKTRQQHRDDSPPFEHAKGESNGRAKLTQAQIPEIRALLATGELSLAGIGRRYGVGHETIKAIETGRTWSHVPISPGRVAR
jgi:hypothetical protein